MNKRQVDRNISGELRHVSFKLCGLAYVIGNQRNDQAPPLDLEEHYYGLGQVLLELGQEIAKLSNEIEGTK